MRIAQLLTSTFLLAISISISSPALAADETTAKAAVAAAQAAVAQNRKGAEDDYWALWKDTLNHLEKAKKALKAGDFSAALNEANQAKFEADAGLAQFREQANMWQPTAKLYEDQEKAWVAGRSK